MENQKTKYPDSKCKLENWTKTWLKQSQSSTETLLKSTQTVADFLETLKAVSNSQKDHIVNSEKEKNV